MEQLRDAAQKIADGIDTLNGGAAGPLLGAAVALAPLPELWKSD